MFLSVVLILCFAVISASAYYDSGSWTTGDYLGSNYGTYSFEYYRSNGGTRADVTSMRNTSEIGSTVTSLFVKIDGTSSAVSDFDRYYGGTQSTSTIQAPFGTTPTGGFGDVWANTSGYGSFHKHFVGQ